MDKKWRKEYKFIINKADRMIISSRLPLLMERDKNAKNNGSYSIRTLYFDDVENSALFDKMSGNPRREKYRLRYYDFDYSRIRLEKKVKVKGGGYKKQEFVTKEECEKIIAGDIEWMFEDERSLIKELYLGIKYRSLHPVSIVDYDREPFVYAPGNVRITLDYNIATSNYVEEFFNTNLGTVPTYLSGECVLEVKYDEFLADFIAQAIQLGNRIRTPMSKYAASRVYR